MMIFLNIGCLAMHQSDKSSDEPCAAGNSSEDELRLVRAIRMSLAAYQQERLIHDLHEYYRQSRAAIVRECLATNQKIKPQQSNDGALQEAICQGLRQLEITCVRAQKREQQPGQIGDNLLRQEGVMANSRQTQGFVCEQTCLPQKLKDASNAAPNDSIILNNANVPIKEVRLIEKNSTVRLGVARSPQNRPEDRSVWDIPMLTEGMPFTLEIVTENQVYRWSIGSIDGNFGNEFSLIQKKYMSNRQGTKTEKIIMELKQIIENATDINGRSIPLLNAFCR